MEQMNFKKIVSPPQLAVLLIFVICLFILFIPPICGYADNGDFYRSMLSNGIYRLPSAGHDYVDFVVKKYGIFQYYNENKVIVYTSQSLFVKLALILNKLFYSSKFFDIRFLGIIYTAYFLPAIYLLVKSLTFNQKNKAGYLIALLVVMIFGDASFILYFNSFYAEPVMIIAFIYVVGSYLALIQNKTDSHWSLFIVYFFNILILMSVKQQNAPLALSFIIMSLGLWWVPQLNKVRRVILGLSLGLILVVGIGSYTLINRDFNNINTFQSFSHGVLLQNGDPSDSLKRTGMSARYSMMRNRNYYIAKFADADPQSPAIKKDLISRLSVWWFIKYYSQNLPQFQRLLDVATKDLMVTKVNAVGNYERAYRNKRQLFWKFASYSSIMGAFFPGKFAFLALLVIFFFCIYSVSFYRGIFLYGFTTNNYGVMRFSLIVALLSIMFFVPIISIIGDGDADLAKHLLMAPLSFDMLLLIYISNLLHHNVLRTD